MMMFIEDLKVLTNSTLFTLGLMTLGPIGGLLLFTIQYHWRGQGISERVKAAGGSIILSSFLKEYGYWWLKVPARVLIALRIHPTTVTLGGMMVVLMGAAAVSRGFLGLGGLAILLGSLSDMLDGIVARARNLTSRAGEFVDSFTDRYTDLGVFAGVGAYYYSSPVLCAWVAAAALGTIVLSYGRAKAEALGIKDAPKGPIQRAERAVLLGFGIYLSPAALRLWDPLNGVAWLAISICVLIAVLANISAIQLARYTTAALRRQDEPTRGPRA
jgi:phosphatidylglycerophosphate synthase